MPFSDPLLPAEYIQKVKSDDCMRDFESSVYDMAAHENRVGTRNWVKPRSPDVIIVFQNPTRGFTDRAKRTYLHYYAREGDVLAVSELIVLGANPNKADTDGITPLHLVFLELSMVKNPLVAIVKADLSGLMDVKRLYARLSWVVHILVEQHANVNIKVGQNSILDLSCNWRDWDLITLLLKHGANPSPNSMPPFASTTDKKRFLDLVKASGPRPARVCPCLSGKTVPHCHGKEPIPYPLKYMCVCGSTKLYERCCYKRGKFVSEKWDDASQRVTLSYDNTNPLPTNIQHKLAAELLSKGLIDPAFGYAMGIAEFLPMYLCHLFNRYIYWLNHLTCRPDGRASSRSLRDDLQSTWNLLVDNYIALGTDSRPRDVIERKAKIGSGNGALYRICEKVDCQKVESSLEKFSRCGQCKAVSPPWYHLQFTR